MLKGSGIVVVNGLTVVAGRYEACLMLVRVKILACCVEEGVYVFVLALTVRERMTS